MIDVKIIGRNSPSVILLHGGPGAYGCLLPVAQKLSRKFRVLVPHERRSGDIPLTVAVHINDLQEIVTEFCPDTPPVIIGHSWGAMLALAWSASHPGTSGLTILVGCGTFNLSCRDVFKRNIEHLMTEEKKRELRSISQIECQNKKWGEIGRFYRRLYACDPLPTDVLYPENQCDAEGGEETWKDMLLQQENKIYPQVFTRITEPVLMIHGDHDPHPGRMIRDNLKEFIPHLEYIELDHCGHEPWNEKEAHEKFYSILEKKILTV
jgi:pimeloyl-ACP methyl ester carboxylesterase